ncbi:MAG: gamma carbonic anhydrase family protein [Deltaproteobacteria bacterium]|nr:gamma carbonic anhydrase family protein [Deltaproteobacteria bacterium]
MPIFPYLGKTPRLGTGVFIAPGAVVVGDVEIGSDSSLWFHTVARGDVHSIRIGARTNIQDGCVLHVSGGSHSLTLGSQVVVGHGAVVHGCVVEDRVLIGIGARVLDGAVLEEGSQVAAGAVVAPGTRVPSGHLVMGVPARVVRPLSTEEQDAIIDNAERYVELKETYRRSLGREADLP